MSVSQDSNGHGLSAVLGDGVAEDLQARHLLSVDVSDDVAHSHVALEAGAVGKDGGDKDAVDAVLGRFLIGQAAAFAAKPRSVFALLPEDGAIFVKIDFVRFFLVQGADFFDSIGDDVGFDFDRLFIKLAEIFFHEALVICEGRVPNRIVAFAGVDAVQKLVARFLAIDELGVIRRLANVRRTILGTEIIIVVGAVGASGHKNSRTDQKKVFFHEFMIGS